MSTSLAHSPAEIMQALFVASGGGSDMTISTGTAGTGKIIVLPSDSELNCFSGLGLESF